MSNVLSKDFLYYYRISIKEGLDIQTEKPHLDLFDEKNLKKVQPLCTTFCDCKKIQEREMGL